MSARNQTSLQNAIKNLFEDVNENFKEDAKSLLHYWTSQVQSQQLIHVRVDVNLGFTFKAYKFGWDRQKWKQEGIRMWFKHQHPTPQILFFQEHHLNAIEC